VSYGRTSNETLVNGVVYCESHEFIYLKLGNGRTLSSSYGGDKAKGDVPEAVIKAWFALRKTGTGDTFGAKIKHFATVTLPTLWPEWNQPPKGTGTYAVGDRVKGFFGPRKGWKAGAVVELPKGKRAINYTVKFDGDAFRTLLPCSMFEKE